MRTITSLAKGLKIFEQIAASPDGKKAVELSRLSEMPSSNLTLFLNTLIETGYIVKNETEGRYLASGKILAMGEKLRENPYASLIVIAREEMTHLHDTFNENTVLSVLNGDFLKVIKEINTTRRVRIVNNEEDYFLPHQTAAGKAILAFLPTEKLNNYINNTKFVTTTATSLKNKKELTLQLEEVKARGYSVNRGEHAEEIFAVSAPILIPSTGENGSQRYPVGAFAIQFPAFRSSDELVMSYAEALKKSAEKVAQSLLASNVV